MHRQEIYATEFNDEPIRVYKSNRQFGPYEKCAAGLCNSAHMVPLLRAARDKTSAMLQVGAYLHSYERFGVDRMRFEQAIYILTKGNGFMNSIDC